MAGDAAEPADTSGRAGPSRFTTAARPMAANATTEAVIAKYHRIRANASGAPRVQASQVAARKNNAIQCHWRASPFRVQARMPVASGRALSHRRTERRRCITMIARQIVSASPTTFCKAACAGADSPSSNATTPIV